MTGNRLCFESLESILLRNLIETCDIEYRLFRFSYFQCILKKVNHIDD